MGSAPFAGNADTDFDFFILGNPDNIGMLLLGKAGNKFVSDILPFITIPDV